MGERAVANPNSGLIWEFTSWDTNDNGKIEFEENMRRTMANVVIHNDLLVISDFDGLVHCLDPHTGKPHWNCDTLTFIWASPLIVDDTVYVASEDRCRSPAWPVGRSG